MTTFESKTTWGVDYDEFGLGGLLGAPLSAMGGFGKFLLVILALSIVANNIPNMYSFALTFQAFGKYAQAIPRIFLVLAGTAIYIVLAIVGADHFADWLNSEPYFFSREIVDLDSNNSFFLLSSPCHLIILVINLHCHIIRRTYHL